MQDPMKTAETAAQAVQEVAMAAPGWILAFHILGVTVYAGGVITLSRMLGVFGALEEEARRAAAGVARRTYLLLLLPMGILMAATGIWMLISDPGHQGYMKQPAFHVKLTLVAALFIVEHVLVIRPLKAMAKGAAPPSGDATLPRAGHILCVLLVTGILIALFVLRGA